MTFLRQSTISILTFSAICTVIASTLADEPHAHYNAVESSSAGKVETSISEIEATEHNYVLNSTIENIRRVVESINAAPMGTGCDYWADSGSLSSILLPVPGATKLIVREQRDAMPESSVSSNLTYRNYTALSFNQSGSPAVGEINIRLPKAVAEIERTCVRKLRGTPIQWLTWPGEVSEAKAGKIMVKDVRFARAVRIGQDGDTVNTGDTIAQLYLEERWFSMVYREVKAQRWGIVAGMISGILLSILTALGIRFGRLIRSSRLVDRSNRDELVEVEESG